MVTRSFEIIKNLSAVLIADFFYCLNLNNDLPITNKIWAISLDQWFTFVNQQQFSLCLKRNLGSLKFPGQTFLINRLQKATAHHPIYLEYCALDDITFFSKKNLDIFFLSFAYFVVIATLLFFIRFMGHISPRYSRSRHKIESIRQADCHPLVNYSIGGKHFCKKAGDDAKELFTTNDTKHIKKAKKILLFMKFSGSCVLCVSWLRKNFFTTNNTRHTKRVFLGMRAVL